VDVYWNLRNRKGVTREVALRHMMRRTQFGMMMVREGQADGICAGWTLEYPEVIRPALQIVGTRPGVRRAAGMYMMVFKNDVKFFADATINIDPDAETLADIAVQVADAVREFDLQPRVAMLSFSNFGSAPHPQTERVRRAVQLVRERRPDLEIDGEMQADVAVDYAELKDQFPFARLRDEANVLVFPDLASGNIAYKLVGRLGGAEAIGPIVLGVRKPVTVLARGCPVSTIVNMAAITVMKAQGEFDRSLLDRAAAAGASEGK
jgi:malate dehydrogenase (oxaloacetate-decarboxylating)(NADP+)